MFTVTAGWLQSLEALHDVPLPQLEWLIENSEKKELAAGEFLFQPGERHTGTHFIFTGRIRLYRRTNSEITDLLIFEPGSIGGYLPFSRGLQSEIYAEAVVPAQYLTYPIGRVQEMVAQCFELTQALVHVMTSRVRNYTSFIKQNEKMLALGKLSAGLAHELNNPAAAVTRGAASLKQHLQKLPAGLETIAALCMSPDKADVVNEKLLAFLHPALPSKLSLLEQSDREDELYSWLQQYQIGNAAVIAESFTEAGITLDQLDELSNLIPGNYLTPTFNWLHNNLVTERLVTDIAAASTRIAQLVGAVKTFTHMDQGNARELADIHEGLESTLVILGYKIRHGNVQVIKHFTETLPRVSMAVGEINQVWTNLLDNALDAMLPAGNGTLAITTGQANGCVTVSITDNGPGIPEAVAGRIFEPFFTTKPVGKGTGLGLDIADNIVRQHKGSVTVHSVPGSTTFTVSLPLQT